MSVSIHDDKITACNCINCNPYRKYTYTSPVTQPHKCPACEGKGIVPCGFYSYWGASLGTTPEQCKSCEGKGIIWR